MRNNHQINQSEDSISKISRSKSKNQLSIVSKLKEKESRWNERFHLEQIPEYNYQNQPISHYLKNKFRIPNRKNQQSKAKRNYEPSLQKNKVSNKPNPSKNEERIKQAINKAFSDLKTLWYQKFVPACHMQIMTKIFNRENYPMKILQDIKNQFSEISKQTSLVQKAASAIQSRDACVQKIDEITKQYESQQLNKVKAGKAFQQKISHLRILTIHCIQCIYQWKQSIQTIAQKKIKPNYIKDGKSYMLKILDDYHRIINSKINQIYHFEDKKADPFFLNYTLDNKKISNVSKNLVKRIRLCQIMLLQEQQKIQEEPSKRTPLIQKMKSPQTQDKSMPPRMKTQSGQIFKKIMVEYGQFGQYYNKMTDKSVFSKSFLPIVQISKYEQITVYQHTQSGDQIVFGADKFSSQRKIVILAVKSNLQNGQQVIKAFCEYLWEHDACSEIRISLVHFLIADNIAVDAQLQKIIKSVGFRWISVNHNDNIRMTIFAIKRPLDTIAHKTARRKQAYPVIIQHLTVFSLAENNQKKTPNKSIVSILSIIELLKEQKGQQYEQICRRDQFFVHLDSIKKISSFFQREAAKQNITEGYQTSFSYSGLKAFQIDKVETIQKIFRNVEISPSLMSSSIFPQYISLLNTSFKFGTPTINDGKFTKFFPSKDSEILICQSNYPIYLLQTDEESINFFIIQVEQGFSMESIDSIFHSMGQQSSFIDQFWLPMFSKKRQYADQVGLRNSQLISTDYWTYLGSLTRKSKVRTKIIKAPFVFGVIHKRLLEMLQVPLYCTLVNKQDLL